MHFSHTSYGTFFKCLLKRFFKTYELLRKPKSLPFGSHGMTSKASRTFVLLSSLIELGIEIAAENVERPPSRQEDENQTCLQMAIKSTHCCGILFSTSFKLAGVKQLRNLDCEHSTCYYPSINLINELGTRSSQHLLSNCMEL